MFIAPLSTIAKRWKQPKCPSRDKWINKMWFIYTMEYSSTLKRKVGFPCGSVVKNLPTNAGDSDSIPGWRRSPGEGNGNSLQYFSLGNPMDRAAWQATVHGVSDTTEHPRTK